MEKNMEHEMEAGNRFGSLQLLGFLKYPAQTPGQLLKRRRSEFGHSHEFPNLAR